MSNINKNDGSANELKRQSFPPAPPAGGLRSAMRQPREEEPTMRSVSIGSPLQRTLHFEPILRRDAPSHGLRPLAGFGQKSPAASEFMTKQRLNKPSPNTKPPAQNWEVDHGSLLPRPCDFPLERTSRVIKEVQADVVSRRISVCLQSRSIKVKYSKTETLAKCRNTDFVKFNVRLFAEDEGVLVEVQRLCGDCMSFTRDCRSILDASEGLEPKKADEEQPLFLRLPVSEMSFMKSVKLPPLTPDQETEPIDVAAELLASNRSDSNMLGMESLVSLTDSAKTLKSTAVISSKRVVSPDGKGNDSFNLHNYVMSLIIYGSSDDEARFDDTAMEEHDLKLRNHAMCVLSNAFSLLAKEGCLTQTIMSCSDWYADVLIPKLVNDLSLAVDHPHDVCYITRCLSTLALASNSYASKIKKLGGLYALKNAEEVGVSEFALLARDAGLCHATIVKCLG